VLVVEDEPLLAMTLEMGLEDAGFTVVLATTGDAAIAKLEAKPSRFSAVMTDIRMPGTADGWQVGRRARDLRPGIPVIYASGDSCAHWQASGVPGSAILPKPFSMDLAVQCLERCLEDAEWEFPSGADP
jgi:DNA-binding NtrC family response regulator